MSSSEEEKYKVLYDEMIQYTNASHEKNKRRITIGLRCLCIIPIVFLILMFTVTESRVAFLVIWILSVLIITTALIAIEYVDYRQQLQMSRINGTEVKIDALTGDKLKQVEYKAKKIQSNLEEMFGIPDDPEDEEDTE